MLSVAICISVAFAVYSRVTYREEHYWDSAPDGWYRQREGISLSQVSEGHLFLPICGHSYLGPLHGYWKLSCDVNITESGWYNLRLQNNTIVEAVLREKSDETW